jgi:hypothetical protein
MRTRARTKGPTEKAIQAQIVTLLRLVGARVYVLGTRRRRGDYPGTMQTPGVPDLWAFLPRSPLGPGYDVDVVWVEVKAAGGRLRPEQRVFLEDCVIRHVPHVFGGVNEVISFLMTGGWLTVKQMPHYRWPTVAAGDVTHE